VACITSKGAEPLRLSFQSTLASSGKYRPDIDGLRALAVSSVVFFHAHVPGFSGGFVGVDIFYVISGYLITSLIAKDVTLNRFSFISFYERRMRRIFPALFTVLFFTTLTGMLLLNPKDFIALGKSVVAMTLFVSNIFFKREAGTDGYFGHAANSQPLLHTWSLSVEEQFYLLFPLGLLLLIRWTKNRVTTSLYCVAALSFAISVWAAYYRPLSAFYLLIPRAWELLIGALLAMKAVLPLKHRVSREIAALAGLTLIASSIYIFNKDTTFPGLSALLPCFGAWLIIYAGEAGTSSVRTVLSFRPFVFIGVISYSLYLWHWPALVFSRYFSAGDLTGLQTAAVIAFSVVLAFISFEFVEAPFRKGNSSISRQGIFSLGLAASLISMGLGSAIYICHGFPGRYDDRTRQLVLGNVEREDDYQEVCGNWKRPIHRMGDIAFCEIDARAPQKIMFWGDSHVQQLYPLIKKIHEQRELQDHGVLLAIANGCPPTQHLNSTDEHFYCDSFAKFAMARAEEKDVDTVFIGFNTWWSVHEFICQSVADKCVERLSPQEAQRSFLKELSHQVRTLQSHGKRVIVSLPFPMFDKSIPDLQVRNAVFGRFGLAGTARDITLPTFRDQVALMAQSDGAEIFDPRKSLCNQRGCITQVNGISIYKDDSHIAASQIGILEDNLKQVLVTALAATNQGRS